MPKDPNCGMDVNKNKAEKLDLTTIKNGKKYFFCSKQCKDEFEGKKSKTQKAIPSKGSEKVTIPITGMTCVSCAKTIEKSIKKIKGVSKANINFAAEKAHVEYDPKLTKKQDLEKAIEDEGENVVKKEGNTLR